MKTSFGMPSDATPAEVELAYEAAEIERELMKMARRRRKQ